MDSNESTVILIDQLRASFGKGKTTEEPPGGKFLGFLSSMSLNFRRGKWLFRDEHGNLSEKAKPGKSLSGDSMEPQGREIIVRAEKSRVSRPDLVAHLYFDLNTYQFDHEFEYVKAAKTLDFVERHGTWWWYVLDEETIKVQGDLGLRELVREHPELIEGIEIAVGNMNATDYQKVS